MAVKVINDTFSLFTATLDHMSNVVPILLNVLPVVVHDRGHIHMQCYIHILDLLLCVWN